MRHSRAVARPFPSLPFLPTKPVVVVVVVVVAVVMAVVVAVAVTVAVAVVVPWPGLMFNSKSCLRN